MNVASLNVSNNPKNKLENQQGGLAAYFQEVNKAFRQAKLNARQQEQAYYLIAGHNIVLDFAGSSLVNEITLPLAHLRQNKPSKIDLVISVWDSASTGIEFPMLPWDLDWVQPATKTGSTPDELLEGQIILRREGDYQISYEPGKEYVSFFNVSTRTAIFWVPEKNEVILNDHRPFRNILQWYFQSHKMQVIHASAVGLEKGGAILVGKGGSGKSTNAIACLQSELLLAGDDNVILDLTNGPYAFSIYNSIKVDDNSLRLLSFLDKAEILPATRTGYKDTFFLHQFWPEKISTGFPIKVILVPKIIGKGATRFELLSPANALMSLAPSTLFQIPGENEASFKLMSQLVKSVPCYRLYIGENLADVPGVIQSVITKHL